MTALDDSAPRGTGETTGAQSVSNEGAEDGADSPGEAAPENPTDLPDGFQVQIDLGSARGGDLRYLVGGSPTRLLRMSDAALGMTSDDGRIEVCDNVTRRLARALLDAGIANPRPMFGPQPADVTVVVPVKDNQAGVDRLLDALDGLTVVVVDDGSDVPIVADRPGAKVIRFDDNRGPAAARNAGAAAATTDFVAFLDSDVVPDPDWLTVLLTHFSDPTVGIVAPGSSDSDPPTDRPRWRSGTRTAGRRWTWAPRSPRFCPRPASRTFPVRRSWCGAAHSVVSTSLSGWPRTWTHAGGCTPRAGGFVTTRSPGWRTTTAPTCARCCLDDASTEPGPRTSPHVMATVPPRW
ncbi:Glycosyl transferase family 2 [Gordonia westfalica]|uniref:Glycosyl transferase family 2 n=1 Tax=Gordonia westfalica TaxID=158898 RepID=A0A1H2LRS1_9ACTN|nr:Glycosyl transferase family 2 [Gordonia westfalica]